MLFVINKRSLGTAISVVRDDRRKKTQGFAGPFLRIEASGDSIQLDGLSASASIPATIYEDGVLFLKVTAFRRLLRSIVGEKFVTIQVTDEAVLLDRIRLPLHSNDMLLYLDPVTAPSEHPSLRLLPPVPDKPHSGLRQLLLWDESTLASTDTDSSLR